MISRSRIIAEAGELEPLSPTAARLAGVIADRDSTIDDMVNVIRYDQAMTIDILKYANSVFSGSVKKIATLRDAVIRLGGARILEQIIARFVRNKITGPLPSYGYAEDDLWRHSVASSIAAEHMNSFCTTPVPGLAFTAALLHDIGKLFLGRSSLEKEMVTIWELVRAEPDTYTCEHAEQVVLGFSHADIGADIAALWHLPESIQEAIMYHHRCDESRVPLTDGVRLCNIAARAIGAGLGKEGMSTAVDNELAGRLGIERERFEKLCASVAVTLEHVITAYSYPVASHHGPDSVGKDR